MFKKDGRPKNTGTRITLILTGNADLSGFFKVFITQSFTENTQRFTEEKYFNPLGTIVPEGFLIGKIINEDFFFMSLWLKKTEDGRPKNTGTRILLIPFGKR